MSVLNPIERSKYIDREYKEYLKSSFRFGSSQLQRLFLEQLESEELFKGPYLNMEFPFAPGKNLQELMEEGIVSKLFYKLNGIDPLRPLYAHQEKSIRHVNAGNNAVITTGTGSGKTECFLFPILNDLLKDIEAENKEVGIRAIFLYPMNALVNDQMDRVREILKDYPNITFGFFTGETESESLSKEERAKLEKERGAPIPPNEILSREEIRKNPPHLLFTNYSMLEFLLIRPNDFAIFEPNRLKNWKYVVLDEAHTYAGAKGIEVSLLMRRLTGLADKKPRFILTSATLGEKGKSEAEIVKFAENLTSADFNVSDIIFSKRVGLESAASYRIRGEDYMALKKARESVKDLNVITKRYCETISTKASRILYEVLLKDKNVHELSVYLKDGAKSFSSVYDLMKEHISERELIDLIDLVNLAEKDGLRLCDFKYHSFVRPLSGAYITYGKESQFSLTKTNEIDGLRAFEVGNCKFCSSPYLVGKICKNKETELSYLRQNQEVDIYENYGSEEFVKLDYFLLENTINEDEVDKDSLEAYEICGKCGEIHAKSNLNANRCECDDSYRFIAYKVIPKASKKAIYNNIKQCPCCGHRSNAGVIKMFDVGIDEGTALIGQTLYSAMDARTTESVQKKAHNPFSITPKEPTIAAPKVKQYLTFSDSRQAASFAAVFFEVNHVRILRKRLLWDVIESQQYQDIKMSQLIARLTNKINAEHLFDNELGSEKNAWLTALVDLLKVDGRYDGEGLGLYYFDLDIKETLVKLKETFPDNWESLFGRFNLTVEEVYSLIQVVFSLFKTTPSIDYACSGLNEKEREEGLKYRRFSNYITLKKADGEAEEQSIRSFLPVRPTPNMVCKYVMKALQCTYSDAEAFLSGLFNVFVGLSSPEATEYPQYFIQSGGEKFQVDVNQYVIKNYKTSPYYQCATCGHLTPYNVRGACVKDGCDGVLEQIDPDEVLKDNYYRKQYKTKKIERIVIREHTAQINRKEAKEYQDAFKNQLINILSCSTTFEMGVDIGSLETVFMRNIPPTPANYVQRAGRAGRRRDSAAYILTYCNNRSHDYTYFSDPEKMISGVIAPPQFDVVNHKIIVRHLMAASLGFFFREHVECCGTINEFLITHKGVERFQQYMHSKPKDLNRYINERILPESVYDEYKDFKWFQNLAEGNDEKLLSFESQVLDILAELHQAEQEAKEKLNRGDRHAAKDVEYYMQREDSIKKEQVITALSRYCVTPKYGFPVDVINLYICKEGKIDYSKDLSRDLRIAISEYAPDSEIIVDKEKYTSKYIRTRKESVLPKYWFVVV